MSVALNRVRIEPMTGAIGAEIIGVNLAEPMEKELFSDIYQAHLDHLVIFFRDQVLKPEDLIRFARQFGEPEIHKFTVPMKGYPEIIEVIKEPEETHNWGDSWHTDLTGLPEPPMGSVLFAKAVPPFAGDTQFSNMYLAYETLSDGMKEMIDGLVVIHKLTHKAYEGFKGMAVISSPEYETEPEHPLVRTHPVTRKKCLFISRKKMVHFKGMTPNESAPLLKFLCDHAENPDFACRFRWKEGSVAFWDNRCTQHRATADYFHTLRGLEPFRRHLLRVSIKGDRPS
jgi:taurine dioxygenase